ncbi:MAG TPA: hypothetical protein VGG44_00230 [Tepidisphaeraceae bacterium]|jgi:uncharacterized integral membrane protein
MQNLWLKIKIWTKIAVFSLVMIFLLIFVFENSNKPASIWVWFNEEEVQTTVLKLIVSMLLAGVLGTLLVRMAFGTLRQIRDLRHRSATAQMHSDVAELKAKAAMLQTKPSGETPAAGVPGGDRPASPRG